MSATSTDRVRRATVYRKAAIHISENGGGVVLAINRKHRYGNDVPAVAKMREMFADQPGGFWPWGCEENAHGLRILALCFMAAMVEAGDA